MKYYIINDIDRPCMRHVTVKRGDKFYYLSPYLRSSRGMELKHPTSLSAFGFEVEELPGGILFKKIWHSVAIYYDGRSRKWQGETRFVLPYYKGEEEK